MIQLQEYPDKAQVIFIVDRIDFLKTLAFVRQSARYTGSAVSSSLDEVINETFSSVKMDETQGR